MSLLGIDVGTTGVKAVAFDREGRPLASAYREYPLDFPRPGWIELDSNRVMSHARDVVREVAGKTGSDPIRALAVAAQGEAATPVGEGEMYLDRAIVSFDDRTSALPAWWEKRISRRRISGISGMPLHGMHTASKILWIRKNRPAVFRKARQFLCYEDLLFQELGLPPTIDPSLAARTMLYDVGKGAWSRELLGAAGIGEERLARVAPSGSVVGEVGEKAAREFGLPKGVVAVTGGHDQPCGALGAGVVDPRTAMYAVGTVECITSAFARRLVHPALLRNNIACYPHVVSGLWVALAFNFTGGSLLRWYRDTFAGDQRSREDAYDRIVAECPGEPSSLFVLPHFTATGTPHLDTASRGVIAGLRLSTSRGEIVRALLEGVTFEMALNVEVLRRCGARIDSFRATGGGARSAFWMQLKADLLGRPVHAMRVTEAVCLGAAILAGTATGVFRDAREAARSFSRVERTFRPEARRARIYRGRLELYRGLYPALREWLHRL
jgi:xylulokinase